MAVAEKDLAQAERTTVYITPQNRAYLASFRRGEKTRKLNEALDAQREAEERREAGERFLAMLDSIEPVPAVMPSEDIVRLLREGREDELHDIIREKHASQ